MNPRSLLWLGAGRLARLSVTELPRHVNVTAVRRSAVDFAAQHICADISCAEGMAAALATKPDYVVFSMSPDARSEAAYRTSYLRPMQLLIQGLAQRDWRPTVIAVSSSSVWAQDQGPVINENFAPLSQSPTAKVLIEMEKALQMSTLPHCIVRFSGIYGAGRFHLIRQVQSGNYGQLRWTNRIHEQDAAGVLVFLLRLYEAGVPVPKLLLASDQQPCLSSEIQHFIADYLQLAMPKRDAQQEHELAQRILDNQSLITLGYDFKYPSYRHAYPDILSEYVRES